MEVKGKLYNILNLHQHIYLFSMCHLSVQTWGLNRMEEENYFYLHQLMYIYIYCFLFMNLYIYIYVFYYI